MSVDPKQIKVGQYYATELGQVREVLEIAKKVVERMPTRSNSNPNRKPIKRGVERVRYRSRGHKAGDGFGSPYWVDLEKFARDVEKLVGGNYDPEYDLKKRSPPLTADMKRKR